MKIMLLLQNIKQKKNLDYYDIPGGKIEVYIVKEYNGTPSEFEENDSMWISIEELINQDKKIPSIEILKYLNFENIKLKIYVDEKHNILKSEM